MKCFRRIQFFCVSPQSVSPQFVVNSFILFVKERRNGEKKNQLARLGNIYIVMTNRATHTKLVFRVRIVVVGFRSVSFFLLVYSCCSFRFVVFAVYEKMTTNCANNNAQLNEFIIMSISHNRHHHCKEGMWIIEIRNTKKNRAIVRTKSLINKWGFHCKCVDKVFTIKLTEYIILQLCVFFYSW